MNRYFRSLLAIIFASLVLIAMTGVLPAAASDSQSSTGRFLKYFKPKAEEVPMKKYLDIRYFQTPGFDPDFTSYDIYTSPNARNNPVIVYIHGGAWRMGDKSRVDFKPGYFTRHGFVFVSVNYRLVPDIQYPENIKDIARALASIYRTIDRYGGDPERIFVMGHSAGSNLAALVATDDSRLKALGLDLSIIKGVIPIDFTSYNLEEKMLSRTSGISVLSRAFGDDPAVWRDASPLLHVEKGKNIPPFLLIYAGRTKIKRIETAEMESVLKKNGIRADVAGFPKKNHASVNMSIGDPENETTKAIMAFLNSILDSMAKE
jgi:arylformamidase